MTTMKTAAVAAWVLLILQSASISAQQLPAKASIQGVVTRAATNEPIARAQLTLTKVTTTATTNAAVAPKIPMVTTDGSGQFVFRDLDPGSYTLTIMSNGYVRQEHGQRVIGGPVPPIVLEAGQALKDVVVRMSATGTVSGRVRSTSGRPLGEIYVQLLRRAYSSSGTPRYESSYRVRTNDLGEYRVSWVTPGRYYVSASSVTGLTTMEGDFDVSVERGFNLAVVNYASAYFPGVADPERATVIEVQPESHVSGIDFTLARERMFHLSGRLFDAVTGQPPPQAGLVSLAWGTSVAIRPHSYNAASGRIELPDATPGMYGIVITAGSSAPSAAPATTPRAFALVTVNNSDVEDLLLTMAPPPVISGKIKVDGQLPERTALNSLRVQLVPADNNSSLLSRAMYSPLGASFGSPTSPEGTFSLTGIPNATFRVAVSSLPSELYLKEARMDGADLLRTPSRVLGSSELELVISSNGGRIEGRVVGEGQQPIAGVQVVLTPDISRERVDLFKIATSDRDGRFNISGIAPGDYKLFAWEAIGPYSYFDPDVLKQFDQDGKAVHVVESSRQTVEVKMIPAVGGNQ